MLAAHRASLTQFIMLGGYPFSLTRDGRVVGIMPVDALAWTENTGKSLSDAAADAKRLPDNASGRVVIEGVGLPRLAVAVGQPALPLVLASIKTQAT